MTNEQMDKQTLLRLLRSQTQAGTLKWKPQTIGELFTYESVFAQLPSGHILMARSRTVLNTSWTYSLTLVSSTSQDMQQIENVGSVVWNVMNLPGKLDLVQALIADLRER